MNDKSSEKPADRFEVTGDQASGQNEADRRDPHQETDLSVLVDAVFGESRSNGVIIDRGNGGG